MKNIMNMMKQAQELQAKVAEMQAELETCRSRACRAAGLSGLS